jgi:aspartate 1-decarboxylase
VSVDDWNDKVLVVTYLFSDERDINSLPAYLLKTEEGGLYRLRYISSIELDKMFSQMKDILQLEDTSKVGYVVWY